MSRKTFYEFRIDFPSGEYSCVDDSVVLDICQKLNAHAFDDSCENI